MSYYYSYYLGIEDKSSGLIQPFGPYDSFGKLNPIIESKPISDPIIPENVSNKKFYLFVDQN